MDARSFHKRRFDHARDTNGGATGATTSQPTTGVSTTTQAATFAHTPQESTAQHVVIGELHGVFAASLFLVLALMAIFLFRRTDQVIRGVRKQQRDMVYLLCGIVMIACVVLSSLILFIPSLNAWLHPLHPILMLEGLAIWAFGWAWFVKGGTLGILKDTKEGVVMSQNRETTPA